jgi:hypothetical protein
MASLSAGFKAASIDAFRGLAIGLGGSPARVRLLKGESMARSLTVRGWPSYFFTAYWMVASMPSAMFAFKRLWMTAETSSRSSADLASSSMSDAITRISYGVRPVSFSAVRSASSVAL